MTAACIGILGLATWRKQLKGKTEYELARGVLVAVYRLRNAVSYFRNPFMTAGEISASMEREGMKAELADREYRFKSTSAVFRKRWEKISDASTDLEINAIEVEVLWGRGIQEALVGVSRLISDLNFNVGWYLRELGGYGSGKPEDMERLERYVYSMGPENDDFAKKLSAAVETVEESLKQYLRI